MQKLNLYVQWHSYNQTLLWLFDNFFLMYKIRCTNDIKKASELDKLLQPLHTALFIESNPSPVKYAASLLGMCKPTVRLPLVEIKEETKKKVSDALKAAKLL